MAKMTDNIPAKNVEEYLAAQLPEVRAALEHLRQMIKSIVPQAEEVISYRVPTFKYFGPLIGFAAFENHCSLFVMSPPLMMSFREAFKGYDFSGATIHFATDKPLPEELVRMVVEARMRENEERESKRKLKK